MVSKVRVYGKAQNRTVLGIINAYVVMYPQATLSDLRKAFPNELNPGVIGKIGEILRPVNEARAMKKKGLLSDAIGYFDYGDAIRLADGTEVALTYMWYKEAFDNIVRHARQYGIEVAKFEKVPVGTRGGYRLEYLNGYVPPAAKLKKGMPWWKWLLLILLLIILLVLIILLLRGWTVVETEKIVTVETEKIVTVVDTVYINRLAEFEADFNSAPQFAFDSAVLTEEAKEVLRDLARYLRQNEDIKVHVGGHTSSEGSVQYNQKLSEDRAKSAVDYLIERGVSAGRLSSEGKGSSEPIDPDNLEVNRRTEFRVVE